MACCSKKGTGHYEGWTSSEEEEEEETEEEEDEEGNTRYLVFLIVIITFIFLIFLLHYCLSTAIIHENLGVGDQFFIPIIYIMLENISQTLVFNRVNDIMWSMLAYLIW